MTNYNERLDKIIDRVYLFGINVGLGYRKFDNELGPAEAKAAITPLTKELVAEAKPGNYTLKGHQPDACLNHEKYTSACCGCQRQRARAHSLDEFEQNLLKALEEV